MIRISVSVKVQVSFYLNVHCCDIFNCLDTCPEGWHYFSETNSCYKVVEASKTWDEARTACKEFDAELASIPDEATNTFLTTLTTGSSWIGGYHDSDKIWKWSDGSVWSYTNWCSGQPTYDTRHVAFNCHWLQDGVGQWDDSGSSPSFICQLKLYSKIQNQDTLL